MLELDELLHHMTTITSIAKMDKIQLCLTWEW